MPVLVRQSLVRGGTYAVVHVRNVYIGVLPTQAGANSDAYTRVVSNPKFSVNTVVHELKVEPPQWMPGSFKPWIVSNVFVDDFGWLLTVNSEVPIPPKVRINDRALKLLGGYYFLLKNYKYDETCRPLILRKLNVTVDQLKTITNYANERNITVAIRPKGINFRLENATKGPLDPNVPESMAQYCNIMRHYRNVVWDLCKRFGRTETVSPS